MRKDKLEMVTAALEGSQVVALLTRLLGGLTEDWETFLADNQAAEEEYREIPYNKISGTYRYDLADVYKFVFHQAPEVHGMGCIVGVRSVAGSAFGCNAGVGADFEHSEELVVELYFPQPFRGRPLLSPDAAKALAAQLLEAASTCEPNAFDVLRWPAISRTEASTIPPFGHVTGDIELDLLPTELAGTIKPGISIEGGA